MRKSTLNEQLNLRQIGAALNVPATTVAEYLKRGARATITWPLPDELNDDALEVLLFPPAPASNDARAMP